MTAWNPADTPNFSREEMACKCGCGRSDMDGRFMDKLQTIRNVFGPLVITSGFRCEAHNERVGGGPAHPLGKAADAAVYGHRAHLLVKLAHMEGISGIGVKQNGPRGSRFIHLDTLQDGEGEAPRPWIWSY